MHGGKRILSNMIPNTQKGWERPQECQWLEMGHTIVGRPSRLSLRWLVKISHPMNHCERRACHQKLWSSLAMQVTNIIKHQDHFTTPLLKALILKIVQSSVISVTNGRVRQVTSHHSSRHQLNAQDAKHFSDKAWAHGKSCSQHLGVPG